MHFNTIQEAADYLRVHPAERGGHVYHPLPFPEFSSLKCSSRAAEHHRCWDLIYNAVVARYGSFLAVRVLDVGANAGFHSFRAEAHGAVVVAFEPREVYSAVARAIIAQKSLAITWHDAPYCLDALPPAWHPGGHFDVALVLSSFNWMARGGKRLADAGAELRDIADRSDLMLFEQGFNKGRCHLHTENADHAAAALSLLTAHTSFSEFSLLGFIRPWAGQRRPLIAAWRGPA